MISTSIEFNVYDKESVSNFCQNLLDIKFSSKIFLTGLWEAYGPNQPLVDIDNFAHDNNIPVTWIINKWGQQLLGWTNFKNDIIFFDFFLWRVYNEIFIKGKNSTNSKWNPDSEKYLFLTGKPDKPQRIKLLHLLYSHNMLNNCVYSFFINQGMSEKSKYLLSELSDSDYQKFINDCQRNPDNIVINEQPDSLHYGGIPYDHLLYTDSKFRIISETSMTNGLPWITEKTWITIANKVPFIVAGDYNSCKYLNQLGFYTFDNLFDHTHSYDNEKSIDQRLYSVIRHANHWINNDFIHKVDEINSSIEHNFNHFCKLAILEKTNFESLTGINIDQVIDTSDDISKF